MTITETKTQAKTIVSSTKGKKRLRIFAIAVVILGLLAGSVLYYQRLNQNFASDMLRPVETALLKAGAVKVCDRGSTGRNMDNTQPWYETYYQLNVGREQAKQVVTAAAAEGGFTIRHATLEDRGPLTFLDDRFVDKWFYDTTMKQHSFSELGPGQANFDGSVNADGTEEACKGSMRIDETHSVVRLNMSLPSYKPHCRDSLRLHITCQ